MRELGRLVVMGALAPSYASANLPDFAFFTVSGWPASVYVADAPGSLTATDRFSVGDTVYLNLAFANFGSGPGGASVLEVVLNGESAGVLAFGPLQPLQGSVVTDTMIENLPVGPNEILVLLDAAEAVTESSERNNDREVLFRVEGFGCSNADLAPPFGLIDGSDVDRMVFLISEDDISADLADPTPVRDFVDVLRFQTVAEAGCD